MHEIDKIKGEIALPEAGQGLKIAFKKRDLAVLRALLGESWLAMLTMKIEGLDFEVVDEALRVGLKNEAGERLAEPLDIDDFPGKMPLSEICKILLDGVYYAVFGVSYAEHMTKMQAIFDEQQKEGNPSPPAASPEPISSTL